MKKKSFRGAMVLVLVFWMGVGAMAAPTFQEGGKLPEFKLPVPSEEEHQEYLGLTGKGDFELEEIDAEVVIIEIFSMYCPHCQREAHKINTLYELIGQQEGLQKKVKLIGIGAGNSAFEVNIFRETYQVPFPLFADEDFAIHKALGEIRTPYFIGMKLKNGGHEIFYAELGGFESAEDFLELVLKRSGLKEGQ